LSKSLSRKEKKKMKKKRCRGMHRCRKRMWEFGILISTGRGHTVIGLKGLREKW
jgi:diphthamide synthase subunit DPH2